MQQHYIISELRTVWQISNPIPKELEACDFSRVSVHIDDNAEFLQAYEKKSDEIYDNFLKYHTMDCGDYYITVYEDDEDVNRPN